LWEHYSINPLWILEHQDIFTKENVARAVLRCNLVKVLGQQPRYHRTPSGTTMWSWSTGGPRFRRSTISY
jgi:hypothetical protein